MSTTSKELRSFKLPPGLPDDKLIDNKINNSHKYYFTKAVVADVISNSKEWLTKNRNTDFIQNKHILYHAPNNSILIYDYKDLPNQGRTNTKYIALPFFQSHFSLPIKTGEQVFVLVEEKGDSSDDVIYYLTRTISFNNNENPNFAHHYRDTYSIEGLNSANLQNSYLNYVGFNDQTKTPRNISLSTSQLLSATWRDDFTEEPVPDTVKRCGDLLLQGSNNSHIRMSNEQFLPNENFKGLKKLEGTPQNYHSGIERSPFAGSIDLVCGHRKSVIEEIKQGNDELLVLNSREPGAENLQTFELSKSTKENNDDLSAKNVFSRIYMSMDTDISSIFDYNLPGFDNFRGASLGMYSDNIHILAENNLKLSNTNTGENAGILQIDNEGNITIQAGSGNNASRIILKSNGNIILKPGSSGILHLGGDENDDMVAACGVPFSPVNSGKVSGEPIVTTLGGEIFRNNPLESTAVADVRATINQVASLVGPSLNAAGVPPLPLSETILFPHEDPDYFPGEPAPDGFSSSKVLIKK